MKKKVLSLILTGMMTAGALCGCATTTVEDAGEATADTQTAETATAETTSESTTESLTGEGDETIHVFLYMQEHEKEVYQKLIDQFVEEHKDQVKEVVFEVTTQEEYNQKMMANMTANDMPDVFYVGPAAVRSYVDNGYILPQILFIVESST